MAESVKWECFEHANRGVYWIVGGAEMMQSNEQTTWKGYGFVIVWMDGTSTVNQ